MLIDETGKALGVLSLDQALWLAWERDLDVVEVNSTATPRVGRLIDYGKYQYEQAKAENKSRGRSSEVKEIRLTLKIGEHDFEVKRSQADRWLNEGHRVKITVVLIGREMMYADRGNELIDKTRTLLGANYEMMPSRMGKRISAMVGRKTKTKDQ